MKKRLSFLILLLNVTHISATRFDLLLKGETQKQSDITSDQPTIWTALKKRDPVIIAHILNANPDALSYRDSLGRTPLHIAADKTLLPAVKMFLEQGANITARDNDNKTSLDLAKERLQWTKSLPPPSIHQISAIIRREQNHPTTQMCKPCPYEPCKSKDFENIITILKSALNQ